MKKVKQIIQKEEYIALAINKYIAQTTKIPAIDNKLDWSKLTTAEYLGTNFNKKNPLTSEDIVVVFNTTNKTFNIKGILVDKLKYQDNHKFIYSFYINKIFRVNTISPIGIGKDILVNGSQVRYGDIQKKIINASKTIKLSHETCPDNSEYYEYKNNKLVLKYCQKDTPNYSFEVYQKEPIYVDNIVDLTHIKAKIGSKAYVKDGSTYYQYYFAGNTWVALVQNDNENQTNTNNTGNILEYIPKKKEVYFRPKGGCMLANGDVFCWGDNTNKKAGIENYGQLDTTLSADYINTPVMLKAAITNNIKWYNSPYRVKFEHLGVNSTNVCALSPIFSYTENSVAKKFGGDLYCNGSLVNGDFDDVGALSILRKNKYFASDKDDKLNNNNEIYLKNIAMVEGTILVLSDIGKLYTYNLSDGARVEFLSDKRFKEIFAARDIKSFAAIDSDNKLWVWGERESENNVTLPTGPISDIKFNENLVFVNSKDFVLRALDGKYYRTYDKSTTQIDIKELSDIPITAKSVAIYDTKDKNEIYAYVDEYLQLQTNSNLINKCKEPNDDVCSDADKTVFNKALAELNSKDNTIEGKKYANFSRIGIFESSIDSTTSENQKIEDDFTDDSNVHGWQGTRFASSSANGRAYQNIGGYNSSYHPVGISDSKIYDFGKSAAYTKVTIEFYVRTFDIDYNKYMYFFANSQSKYRITIVDSRWENDYFCRRGQGEAVADTCSPGEALTKLEDHKFKVTFEETLDENGQIELGLGLYTHWNYYFSKEHIAIEKIVVEKKSSLTSTITENITQGWTTNKFDYTNTEYGNKGAWLYVSDQFDWKTYTSLENANEQIEIEFQVKTQAINSIKFLYFFINNQKKYRVKIIYMGRTRSYLCHKLNLNVSYADWLNCKNNDPEFSGDIANNKFIIKLKESLDNNGSIKLGLSYTKDTDYIYDNEIIIQNIRVIKQSSTNPNPDSNNSGGLYICATTGFKSATQVYCWGNVGKSIPLLSTSLYNVDKIKSLYGNSAMNKLFITQKSEKNKDIYFDKFNNNGELFLKYPTYIGGFDYPFKFK